MIQNAQKEIDAERQNTLAGAQKEIADLALAAAAKLVEGKNGRCRKPESC